MNGMMNMMAMFQRFQQFKQNPMGMLSKRFNIPDGMNNPDDVLKHLVDSKQVSQEQINQISQMANMFKS